MELGWRRVRRPERVRGPVCRVASGPRARTSHRTTRSSARSGDSGDSGDEGSGEPGPQPEAAAA
jgi:hypothetical protein